MAGSGPRSGSSSSARASPRRAARTPVRTTRLLTVGGGRFADERASLRGFGSGRLPARTGRRRCVRPELLLALHPILRSGIHLLLPIGHGEPGRNPRTRRRAPASVRRYRDRRMGLARWTPTRPTRASTDALDPSSCHGGWSLSWINILVSVSGGFGHEGGYWSMLVSVGVVIVGTIVVWISARHTRTTLTQPLLRLASRRCPIRQNPTRARAASSPACRREVPTRVELHRRLAVRRGPAVHPARRPSVRGSGVDHGAGIGCSSSSRL
jgi:hypothetical protein